MSTPKPTLIILGTGFAGYSLLKRIDARLFNIVVVSPRNHFLFTPLLPSTTVGTVEFRSIIESVRIARPDVLYYQAFAKSLDAKKKTLRCQGALDKKIFTLPYDYLVIAVGARSTTYGVPGVLKHALFLKEVSDARAIRQRIIECFELAARPTISREERKRLLHFVVVGGGPTGVEFAAEMHDFVTDDLRRTYRDLMDDVHITVLEAGDHILNTFDAVLSNYTTRFFKRQQIEVRTRSMVRKIESKRILLANRQSVPYGLVVWSTGIGPTPFLQSLSLRKDKASRLVVDDFFRVKETSQLFAIGDCSSVAGEDYPATAQVAQQEGTYLARALERRVRGLPVEPFRYKNYGMLAYVGSGRALADLSAVKGRGFLAWLFWRSVYITRLVGIKNKILVLFDWAKTFLFGRDISRF